MSLDPVKQQYGVIQSALNQPKHRVVYNNKNSRFEDVTSTKAKELAKDGNYITDLDNLKDKVEQFINDNLDATQGNLLKKAFKQRAEKLEKRTVLFGAKKRDEAVGKLKAVAEKIKKTVLASTKESKNAAPHKQGSPTPKQGSPKGGIALPGMTGSSSAAFSSGAAQPPVTTTSTASSSGAAPPPPPPPPGTAPALGLSFTHKKLTTEADQLRQFEGEPGRPLIEEGHDLGKVSKIPEEDRTRYAAQVDQYIFGTKYTESRKKGINTVTEEKRKEDGLDHTIQRLERELEQHAAELEKIKGIKVQIREGEERIAVLKKRLGQMRNANKKNEDFTLYTIEQGTIGAPISFYANSKYEAFQAQFGELSGQEKKLLKRNNAVPPKEMTIDHQITRFESEVSTLEKENQLLNAEKSELEQRIQARNKKVDNGIPFSQWRAVIDQKKGIRDSWKGVLGNLKKGTRAEDESEVTKNPNAQRLEEVITKLPPIAREYMNFHSTANQATLVAMGKGNIPVVDQDGK